MTIDWSVVACLQETTRQMKLALLLGIVTLVVAGGVAVRWRSRGPDVSQFVALREPRLTRMTDQRMLVVEATGDPNVVAGAAFKRLFKTYFTLHGVSKAGPQPAPRARWTFSVDTPRNEWRGRYALPVPEAVSDLPENSAGPMPVVITTWAYGDVAEILHIGSYSTEQPDIERLRAFIDARGYRVVGDHEEEYVKGPGMIFAGDPDTYLTIIRLRVDNGSGTTH
jgi:hypothetical protein